MKMNVNSATFGYLQDRSAGISPPTCAYKAAGRGVGARAAGEGGRSRPGNNQLVSYIDYNYNIIITNIIRIKVLIILYLYNYIIT